MDELKVWDKENKKYVYGYALDTDGDLKRYDPHISSFNFKVYRDIKPEQRGNLEIHMCKTDIDIIWNTFKKFGFEARSVSDDEDGRERHYTFTKNGHVFVCVTEERHFHEKIVNVDVYREGE